MRIEPHGLFDLRLGLSGTAGPDQSIGLIGIAPGIARVERDRRRELLQGVVVPAAFPGDVARNLMRGRSRVGFGKVQIIARLPERLVGGYPKAAAPALIEDS